MASDINGGIGYKNQLPWPKMKNDLKRFKDLTVGHTVIMGRNTFESLGKPLPKRNNIVISKTLNNVEKVKIYSSKSEVIEFVKDLELVFIIGGAQIIELFYDEISKFHHTEINSIFECDTFLSMKILKEWKVVSEVKYSSDLNNPFDFTFYVKERIGS
jgi:dihydrofolate reductase